MPTFTPWLAAVALVAAAGTPSELATSNVNTRAGRLSALRSGVTYQAGSFPIALRITPPAAGWSGAQWRTSSHGRPAFGWAAFARGAPDGPPQGLVEIETAYGDTPPAAAILGRLRSAGGGATFGKTSRVTLAGYHGWQIDGRVYGRFGHVFVPFTPKTGGASPPDSDRLEPGEPFRLVVVDVNGKRVVLVLDGAALPAERFPAFLAAAGRLFRTVRLAG
jgi:hypothetical protein